MARLFIIMYLPTAVLFMILLRARTAKSKTRALNITLLSWLALNAILAIIGVGLFVRNNGYHATLIGYAITAMSSIWASGPLMIINAKSNLHPGWIGAACLFMAPASFFVAIAILFVTGHVWD
ncbi:MAG: hypothetical protein HY343_11555 [Lentisphaerae bacterium]|nr:hypothetical protein [Lentisphaerota bacterium]